MFYGLAALLIFVLDIYVIYLIMTSSLDTGMKLVWVILVLLLPLLGPILYLVLGRGASAQ
jgi:Phospholipase_D-nuclease N-terminal